MGCKGIPATQVGEEGFGVLKRIFGKGFDSGMALFGDQSDGLFHCQRLALRPGFSK